MYKKVKTLWRTVGLAVFALCLNGCIMVEPIPYIEVTVEDSTFEDKFYYEQLTEEDQLTYRELYQGLMDHQKEIYVHGMDPDKVNAILHDVMFDYAEIFWTDGSAMSSSYEEGYTIVEMDYIYSQEERAAKEAEIEAATADILSQLSAQSNEYDKIKSVYEYLVNGVEYVEGAQDNQNLYSALVGKETVCAGYAKANQYLLNELGISCIYVVGTATNEDGTASHAWNIVECDDKYYYVDVTWADPIPDGEEPAIQSEMIYDYLCCDESVMADTHVAEEGRDYPVCDSDDLNYYKQNGMFYETVDRSELLSVMKTDIDAKENSTIFKFATSDLYAQADSLLLDGLMNEAAEYLCERYDLWEVEYNYEEDHILNKFIIYWQYE